MTIKVNTTVLVTITNLNKYIIYIDNTSSPIVYRNVVNYKNNYQTRSNNNYHITNYLVVIAYTYHNTFHHGNFWQKSF